MVFIFNSTIFYKWERHTHRKDIMCLTTKRRIIIFRMKMFLFLLFVGWRFFFNKIKLNQMKMDFIFLAALDFVTNWYLVKRWSIFIFSLVCLLSNKSNEKEFKYLINCPKNFVSHIYFGGFVMASFLMLHLISLLNDLLVWKRGKNLAKEKQKKPATTTLNHNIFRHFECGAVKHCW